MPAHPIARRLAPAQVLVGAMALAACQATTDPARVTAPPQTDGPGFRAMLDHERGARGLTRLEPDPALTRAARAHALDMVQNNYFSHTGQDGSRLMDRALAAGYCRTGMAENIARGQSSEAEVFAGWFASPGHRRNLLRDGAEDYGLARVADVWVMMVGDGC